MHFNEVRATAFGPFRSSSLRLARGFNVIHGPNEAGKSSWFAATYAGLAGRRRARGRGTAVQAEFARRHRPWTGSQWRTGVTLTLDDGLVLALEHDLRSGDSRILDSRTGRPIAAAELGRRLGIDLTTDTTLDGTRLLGLNRDTARATLFTGQADILRVLEDAGELQEFIERAATSEGADATADGALAWLSDLRSELVGSEHLGRKPLRTRTHEFQQARAVSGAQRDRLIRLTEVIAERRRMSTQLAKAKEEVDRADRIDKWIDIRAAQQRIEQAEALSARIDSLAAAVPVVDEDRVRVATMIIGAYDAGFEVKPLPAGATAAELEAEIVALPPVPEGDVEPRKEVLDLGQELTRASAALKTHGASAPEPEPVAASPHVSADDLRKLAAVLETRPPVADPHDAEELASLQAQEEAAATAYREAQATYKEALRRNEERRQAYARELEEYARLIAEFERAQAARAAQVSASKGAAGQEEASRKRRMVLVALGIALVLSGVVVAVVGPLVAGIAVAAIGVAVSATGLLAGRSAPTRRSRTPDLDEPPLTAPRQPSAPRLEEVVAPAVPAPNPRAMELQVDLKAQATARRQHDERAAQTRQRIHELSLEEDPQAIRRLARAIDDAVAATTRRERYEEQLQMLVADRERAARALGAALDAEISHEVTDQDLARLVDAMERYVAACRQRATTASLAARRVGLCAALEQRRQLEEAHAVALDRRDRQLAAVVEFVRGLEPSDPAPLIAPTEAAEKLRSWLAEQHQARTEQAEWSELTARLDQLLDCRPLADCREELARMIDAAGPEPEERPTDPEILRAQVTRRYEAVLRRVGDLHGQQTQLGEGLGSVAEAVEVEAAAERALAEVQSLRTCLDSATAQLKLAKDRAHATIAPALEARVRPWLPRVTEGRYLDVAVDPSDLTMKVTESSGAVREAHLLSHGTTEQIFLLLRIALSQVLSGRHESTPLVLDDITVHSDLERTQAILRLLHDLSAEHQVVLFTQEQEVVDWAHANLTEGRDTVLALTGVVGA